MGRTSNNYSPEQGVEIKVQPRQSPNLMAAGGPPPQTPNPHHNRLPPPPRSHKPYMIVRKWIPWLVPTITIVNIVLFVIAMYLNNCPTKSNNCIGTSKLGRFAFQSTRENPLLGPSANTLLSMGALEVRKVVVEHQVWRLASCMWLHAGVVHLLANMLSMLFVAIRLEQEFGFVRIGLLYVISGIGGSLISSLFVRTSISVGASGALFGLLGAMLSELLINWTMYEDKLASLLTLIIIIVINLAVGILPHVDNFAHLGGFFTGFLLGFVILIRPQYGYVNRRYGPSGYGKTKSKYKIYQYIFLVISLLLLVAGFVLGFSLLLRGVDGNQHCSWCHYLSCVPTPLWACEARCSSNLYGNQLNMTCLQNQRSRFYTLDNGNSTALIQSLCVQLCRG